jgi:hypothetical protein
LLDKIDYTEVEVVFRHPERKMIFVGDFVDRGPQQREVLRIAARAERSSGRWLARRLAGEGMALSRA